MPRHAVLTAAILLAAFAVPAAGWAVTPAEQQLLDFDQALVAADVAGDRAAFIRMLDDRFITTFDADRRLLDKASFLALISGGWDDRTRAQSLSDRHVVIDGDTGIVIETDTVSGTRAGKPYRFAARLTATYIRRAGTWKVLALHFVTAPPGK